MIDRLFELDMFRIQLVIVWTIWLVTLTRAALEIRNSVCASDEFSCLDGTCIKLYQVCDGAVDCACSSDEKWTVCTDPDQNRCPSYAFTCKNGACVHLNAMCNGTYECSDKSDEINNICANTTSWIKNSKNCPDNQFLCSVSEECIYRELVCDGVYNCQDRTDESIEVCQNEFCPAFAYQCKVNGACIDIDKFCETTECNQNADKEELFCSYFIPQLIGKIGTEEREHSVDCLIDISTISYGYIVLEDDEILDKVDYVRNGSLFFMRCVDGFQMNGNDEVEFECENGKAFKADDFPECTKPCSATNLFHSSYYLAFFSKDNELITYDNVLSRQVAMSKGTIVRKTCKSGYKNGDEQITCSGNGEWSSTFKPCTPSCGKPIPNENVNGYQQPWHAGIYFKASYICGGTIVHPTVIITAAHCFPGDLKSSKMSGIFVGVGKKYVDYTINNETEPNGKLIGVKSIQKHNRFNKMTYENDIALMTLIEIITFSNYIRPICFDSNMDLSVLQEERAKENQYVLGEVYGWGTTRSGMKSVTLKKMEIVITPDQNCTDQNWSLAADQVCAKPKGNIILCKGDSGGAFVMINKWNGNRDLFSIYAVVSAGDQVAGCEKSLKALTMISNHYKKIEKYIQNADWALRVLKQ